MTNLINPLKEIDEYRGLLASAENYTGPVNIVGPSDSQKAHICHALCTHSDKRGIYIAYNEMQARKLYEDFSFFSGEDVLFFPSKEIMLYDVEAKSYDAVHQRLRVMDRVLAGDYRLVVTSAEAVSHRLITPRLFSEYVVEIGLGSRLDLAGLTRRLAEMAYEKADVVERIGQFAVRGGIVDIFSIDSEYAVRIELFDDEVDSIRRFDVNTQRSVDRLESARIIPAREAVYPEERVEQIVRAVRSDLAGLGKKAAGLGQKISADMERIREEHYFPGIDRYIPYIMSEKICITDYAGADALVFVDEPPRLKQRLENILLEHDEICRGLMEKGQLLPQSREMFLDYEQLASKLEKEKVFYLNTINADRTAARSGRVFSIPSKLLGSYQGHMDLLCDGIREWKEKKCRVVVLSGTRGRGERLRETLSEKGIEAVYMNSIDGPVPHGQVVVTHGSLNKGFEYPSIGFVVVSDKEVFGQDRRPVKTSSRHKGVRINLFTELNIGDYVVHQAHGIGQYTGIEKLSVEGVKRDYLKIRYQDGGFLYIPVNQLDLIQKYVGSEGKSPRLSKLGGTDWLKTKNRVKESLKELASELINLYAQRQAVRGFAFSKDTVWQKQFEEQFPYEETDDQLKCIEEIKEDMESGRLMDRLLCGDVGYGKTEVAIRAIFKAAMDGKQVAYLVPTTVLAQQHYVNFVERMKDFPVTVDVISRFRSQSEQKRILKDVRAGNIDVLIGTHRLLQKDIHFKDLGLLVIDEEQRFGVSHKEKLKNLRPDPYQGRCTCLSSA
jgi:transcription-repair coupling factor (superfamily II helicase)